VLSNAPVNVGDLLDVTGIIGTTDGERQLTTGTVIAMGMAAEPVRPYAMRGDMLGGAAVGSVPGITGGIGANNLGLLIKTWGKVKSIDTGCFYIDCTAGTTVKIKSGGLTPPRVGDQVTVVGISTCEVTGGAVCRAVLPRTQQDIVVVQAAP
jgi:hypothetical protein